MKKKVLLLGFTGRIGPGFLKEYEKNYKKDYEIILGFHHKKPEKKYKSKKIDLSNISNLKKAMKGISVVINFSAESNPEAPFEKIINPNIIGAYNVFEAARQSKCKRIIFASSVHAIKGYKKRENVKHDDIPKPDNLYGTSKVFGESLCYVFSEKHNLSCLAIRIGAYVPDNLKEKICLERKNFDYVISQRDLAQLIHKCITANKEVKYGILSGSSNNKRKYMDLEFSKKLVGYKPKDDAYKLCNIK